MPIRYQATVFALAVSLLATGPAAAAAPDDWPTWRYDAARSGAWPGTLPETLQLHWRRERPAPQRAWPPQRDDGSKLEFDVSSSPVAAGGLVFVPSNTTDSVSAYQLEDGRERWRFHAGGPVRLAPTYDGGRLFFTADDGYLYCLDAAEGRLRWKFRGGPADHYLLGNERIISFWAARGAPLVNDGIVYFAAGLWPLHGIFIHALEAASGEPVWVNDTIGSDFVRVPRGSVYGGLAPQGYLAVSRAVPERARDRLGRPVPEDYLVISGGRGGPAVLCRQTGLVAADIFDTTGLLRRKQAGGYAVHGVNGGGLGYPSNDTLQAHLETVADQLDGPVFTKIAVGRRLLVTTEKGTLYCFGPAREEPAVTHGHRPQTLPPADGRWSELAASLLGQLGENEGYALVLGAASGDLVRALLAKSALRVAVVEADPEKVAALRAELVAADLHGRRAAVIAADPATFAVQPYLFSLVVSEDAAAAGLVETVTTRFGLLFRRQAAAVDPATLERTLQRLRPYGGLAWLGAGAAELAALETAAAEVNVDQVAVTIDRTGGHLFARRGGPLTGAGQWTHQYHDAANTLLAREERARLPLGVLWFGGPNNHNILGKHSRGPRPQVAGGRQVFLGVDTIAARCVYTGRPLWERSFPGIGDIFDTTANLPGTSYIGSPLVTLPDSVYLRYQGRVYRLDPASGETTARFAPPGRPAGAAEELEEALDWGHLSVSGDYLVTTGEPIIVPDQRPGHGRSYTHTASRRLAVIDRHSGEVRWEREARLGFRHNTICSSGEALFLVDGLPERQLDLLERRGEDPPAAATLLALDLGSGEKRWATGEQVGGTFLLYCRENDILVEGGSRDTRHTSAVPRDEPERAIARSGRDGTVLWENSRFHLPAAVRGEMLISASRFRRNAVCLLSGETWQRTDPLDGTTGTWTYSKSKNCDSLNASSHLLLFRTTYAGFFDLDHDSGTGFFSGFRSGCTASMIPADGLVNALDYTRRCNCAYPHQASLALVHMPEDDNIEFWTRGAGAAPDPAGHGINFGGPGRRIDVAGSGLTWHHRGSDSRRHPSVISDPGASLSWVLASNHTPNGTIEIDNVHPGTYALRLHFAELDEAVAPGERVFAVLVNDKPVLAGLDIVAAADGPFRGLVRETEITLAGNETLVIELRRDENASREPLISGLELVAAGPGK